MFILEEIQSEHLEIFNNLKRTNNIIAYRCGHDIKLKKGTIERDWMEKADQKFPYRCLPMMIANQIGWDLVNDITFSAVWNGGNSPSDIVVKCLDNSDETKLRNIAVSHFGVGVITFHIGYLIKTDPGINLIAMGPPNNIKDGIQPLVGVIETDWSPATFTMNWKFTRKNNAVIFEKGESFCRIIPIPRYITEDINPVIANLSSNIQLHEMHKKWANSRSHFAKALKISGTPENKRKWQRDYFKGGGDLWPRFEHHQTVLKQKDFE